MRLLALLATGLSLLFAAAPASSAGSDHWQLPVQTLRNGLTLVVSEDHSSPTVGISVIYKVGTRREPRGRSGFAHLFEHLMFQGTPKANRLLPTNGRCPPGFRP
jgi:zinc protease